MFDTLASSTFARFGSGDAYVSRNRCSGLSRLGDKNFKAIRIDVIAVNTQIKFIVRFDTICHKTSCMAVVHGAVGLRMVERASDRCVKIAYRER